MKTNVRTTRINDEIAQQTAQIIRSELKDPRISTVTTVVKAEATKDLKLCKVYVSILGDKEEKVRALEGLQNAAGFIRKQLAANINLRSTPEIKFVLDESLDYSMRIDEIIKGINEND